MSARTISNVFGLIHSPRVDPVTRSTPGRLPFASFCLALSDVLAFSTVFWGAVWVKHLSNPGLSLHIYLQSFPAVVIFLGVFFAQGLYPGLLLDRAEETRRVLSSVSGVFLLLASTLFFWKSGVEFPRSVFLAAWGFTGPAVLLTRFATRKLFSRSDWWQVPAIVLGSGRAAMEIARSLDADPCGFRVTGILCDRPVANWDQDLPPILGSLPDAAVVNARGAIRYVILAMPHLSHAELGKVIQNYCESFHHVLIAGDLPGVICLQASPRKIRSRVGIRTGRGLRLVAPKVAKRSLDSWF